MSKQKQEQKRRPFGKESGEAISVFLSCLQLLRTGLLEQKLRDGWGRGEKKKGQDNVSLIKAGNFNCARPFNSLGKPFPPDSGLSSGGSCLASLGGPCLECSGSWVGHLLNSGIPRPGGTMNYLYFSTPP